MIEYIHTHEGWRHNRGTVAIFVPTASDLNTMMKMEATAIMLPIGVTVCSWDEQFCRRVGRNYSSTRLAATVCSFIRIEQRPIKQGTKTVYHFIANTFAGQTSVTIEFGLSAVLNSEKVQVNYAILR